MRAPSATYFPRLDRPRWSKVSARQTAARVLLLFGNYGGDSMNFEMAAEVVEAEDIARVTGHLSSRLHPCHRNIRGFQVLMGDLDLVELIESCSHVMQGSET
jgi:hypothetical protein